MQQRGVVRLSAGAVVPQCHPHPGSLLLEYEVLAQLWDCGDEDEGAHLRTPGLLCCRSFIHAVECNRTERG
eukprot:COSAG06_NODE_5321_length_3558_cov_2.036138_4_plen_71_part_00